MGVRRLLKIIGNLLLMFVANGKFNLVCNRTRTCYLLLAPAGPDFLSVVWKQSLIN